MKKRPYTTNYIGTYDIKELDYWKKYYKKEGIRVKFRGRGPRKLINHEKEHWKFKQDLPLNLAERIAIYYR